MAKNKLQKAANEIVKWTKETGFNISVEKTKAMLIPRVYESQAAQDFGTNHR
jgi:hypothetical protein